MDDSNPSRSERGDVVSPGTPTSPGDQSPRPGFAAPVGSVPTPAPSQPYTTASQGVPAPAPSQPYATAPQGAPIVIQVPPQKQSKGPMIALCIILGILALVLLVGVVSCSRVVGTMAGTSTPFTTGKTVAVIHIETEIASSGSGSVTPEMLGAELGDAENDRNVKAIVLRINSPGGTAAAGEEMAASVRDCSKPVVVSVGDYAASGAYMIASQGDYLIASPASTVGSIGCIVTISNYEGLLNKLGITVENITSGSEKDAGSPYRQLTDAERAKLQAEVDQINGQFIDLVASGRSLDRATVARLADGSTWTGADAVGLHLVDATGTYEDALDKAASLGGISGSYKTVSFDEYTTSGSTSLLDSLGLSESSSSSTASDTVSVR